ncbi:hypothetical protein B7463_g9492, partial [Scytalidium lignicola]
MMALGGARTPLPLIVYGASSALGSFAIKLARQANIHPIIAIAGGSSAYIQGLLDPALGDSIIDYRQGAEKMKADMRAALNGLEVHYALDAIIQGSDKYDEPEIPSGVQISYSFIGMVYSGAYCPTMPKQPEDAESVEADIYFAIVI